MLILVDADGCCVGEIYDPDDGKLVAGLTRSKVDRDLEAVKARRVDRRL